MPIEPDVAPKPMFPFAVTFTDGFYSVRQAHDEDHAKLLSVERHPDRTIESVRQVE